MADFEECCERCGKETPESQEDWDFEGWGILHDQTMCRMCLLESTGQQVFPFK
jgi:hypothetical protein